MIRIVHWCFIVSVWLSTAANALAPPREAMLEILAKHPTGYLDKDTVQEFEKHLLQMVRRIEPKSASFSNGKSPKKKSTLTRFIEEKQVEKFAHTEPSKSLMFRVLRTSNSK